MVTSSKLLMLCVVSVSGEPTMVNTVTIVCIVLGLTGTVVAYIFTAAIVGIRIYYQRSEELKVYFSKQLQLNHHKLGRP